MEKDWEEQVRDWAREIRVPARAKKRMKWAEDAIGGEMGEKWERNWEWERSGNGERIYKGE